MQTIDFKRLNIEETDCVLDLGCGEGRHTIFADNFTRANVVIGLDIDYQDVAKARQKHKAFTPTKPATQCRYLVGDALQLPFEAASFDIIVCSEVLEHLPNYQHALTEIYRVLKPEGRLAISVPRAWPERICWWLSREYHEVEGGHVRIFNAKNLKHHITSMGFTYNYTHWAHALHSPFWWLKCLFWASQDQSRLICAYHKLLVWDLMKKPRLTRITENILNPILGKSVVMYFQKFQIPTKIED